MVTVGDITGGSYCVAAEISVGSFGSIYAARHVIFDDDPIVAVKLLHTHLTSQKEHDRFKQEARFTKKP